MPRWNNGAMILIIKGSTTKINQLNGTRLGQAPELHFIRRKPLYHSKHFLKYIITESIPYMKWYYFLYYKNPNTLTPGSFTYSEDTSSIFSGFRSVWIKHKSCISAGYDKSKETSERLKTKSKQTVHPWTIKTGQEIDLGDWLGNIRKKENERDKPKAMNYPHTCKRFQKLSSKFPNKIHREWAVFISL